MAARARYRRRERADPAQADPLAARLPVRMKEEIFAVVDASDTVIDYRPRSEVHRLGLRHRSVHVWVYNRMGELLLQKRSRRKECFPGMWDSAAAGHVDRGEAYDECAVRELQEELGVTLDAPLERLFKLEASAATGWEFCWVYRCTSDGPFELNPEEVDAVAWFAPAELGQRLHATPLEFASTVPLIYSRLHGAAGT
jgi:isopentenyl-diphosphate delta-isomerase type 1